MPSGAKKRKAAKKKKVNNNGSSTTNPNQGENEELINSPISEDPLVEVVKKEDDPSENKLKQINEEEQGNIEIETGSKSKSSNGSSSSSSDCSDDESNVVEKKVVIESVPVPVIESSPEQIPPIVDPIIKPVDSLLDQVSQVFDEIKDERKGFVIGETPVVVEEQQTIVVSEIDLKDDCPSSSEVVESVLKENEVESLPKLDEKVSFLESSSSTPPKELMSEVKGAECANETDTVESSDRQTRVASTPLSVQKTTSWKSCCGIFDLFTGSQRN